MSESKFTVGAPIPSSIGRCADLYKEVQQLRLDMEKEVAEVKARENELKQHMIDSLDASDDTGASGLKYRVQIKKKTLPKANDWDSVWAYVIEHGRTDFLQKRLNDKAVMDTLEEAGHIPGIERVNIKDVSVTKI